MDLINFYICEEVLKSLLSYSKMGRLRVIFGIIFFVVIYALIIILPIVFIPEEKLEPDPIWPNDQIDEEYLKLHDCLPDKDYSNENECLSRGCNFDESMDPACSFNSSFYKLKRIEESLCKVTKYIHSDSSPLISEPIRSLEVEQSYAGDNIGRVQIRPSSGERWEVPFKHPKSVEYSSPKHLEFLNTESHSTIAVFNDEAIFDTHYSPLVYEDQFMQLSTRLPSKFNYYGLGETDKEHFQLDRSQRKRTTIWPVGLEVKRDKNGYGHHPFIMGVSEDGKTAFALCLINSNLMEIELIGDMLIYRTTGGVFDIYILTGKSPGEVLSSYHQLIGTTFMPPYWAYGYQLSKWGYRDLDDLKNTVQRNRQAGIPLETQYIDIDYMERALGFTVGQNFTGLDEFAKELEQNDMKLVLIFDPTICTQPYTNYPDQDYKPLSEAYAADIFIKRENGNELLGIAYAGLEDSARGPPTPGWTPKTCPSAYPDFFMSKTANWWQDQLSDFHRNVPFHAIWIDKNEPANYRGQYGDGAIDGCDVNNLNNPPFVPALSLGFN